MNNQKSLDKKNISELFEGVGSTLHQAFIGAVERDKKKTKELEWEKEFDKQFNIIYSPRFIGDKWNFVIKDFIQSLLTQQRTEILEEILNLECLKEEKISKELKTQAKELEKMNEYCVSADEILEDIGEKYNERNQLRKEIIDEIKKL